MVKKKRPVKRDASPLAVVTADTHLHDLTWRSRPNLRGDSYYSFRQIIDYARGHDLPLIIAGDVLDKRINESGVPYWIRQMMDTMENSGLHVYYIQGQHELQLYPWLSAVHPWSSWVHETAFRLGEYSFYGIDWTPASGVEDALARIPEKTDVLVMHQTATEFMGGLRECELTLATVPHARLLIIGDYHVSLVGREVPAADGRELIVLSPGSTCLQKIDESPTKFFYVLYDDLSVTPHQLQTRKAFDVTLLTQLAVDEFVEVIGGKIALAIEGATRKHGCPEELHKPILRVHYAAGLEGAYRRIVKAVGKQAHLFTEKLEGREEEERPRTELSGKEALTRMKDLGLSAFLPEVVDKDTESELFNLCQELLEAGKPEEIGKVLARTRTRFELEVEAG